MSQRTRTGLWSLIRARFLPSQGNNMEVENEGNTLRSSQPERKRRRRGSPSRAHTRDGTLRPLNPSHRYQTRHKENMLHMAASLDVVASAVRFRRRRSRSPSRESKRKRQRIAAPTGRIIPGTDIIVAGMRGNGIGNLPEDQTEAVEQRLAQELHPFINGDEDEINVEATPRRLSSRLKKLKSPAPTAELSSSLLGEEAQEDIMVQGHQNTKHAHNLKAPEATVARRGSPDTIFELLRFFIIILLLLTTALVARRIYYKSTIKTGTEYFNDVDASLDENLARSKQRQISKWNSEERTLRHEVTSGGYRSQREIKENFLQEVKKSIKEWVDKDSEDQILKILLEEGNVIARDHISLSNPLEPLGSQLEKMEGIFDMKNQFMVEEDSLLERVEKAIDEVINSKRSAIASKFATMKENVKSEFADSERILAAIEKYAADRVGEIDYASKLWNSRIIGKSESAKSNTAKSFLPRVWSQFKDFVNPSRRKGPDVILENNMNPGDCWALNGPAGYVTVKLGRKVKVSKVSVQHISKGIAPEKSTALKKFKVWGKLSGKDKESIQIGHASYQFGSTFSVPTIQYAEMYCEEWFDTITIEFTENYGGSYTCIYRVRVHGGESARNLDGKTMNERSERLNNVTPSNHKSF
eukprot:jgi/Bigna1/84919/estExt_fgenesh1_pg.C_10366